MSLPFGGLFGNSPQNRTILQVIADPFGSYTIEDLVTLTKSKPHQIKEALQTLTSLGIIEVDKSKNEYKVITTSKRYIALNFLAYAVLDDREGTNCMDVVIKDYCNDRKKFEDNLVDSRRLY